MPLDPWLQKRETKSSDNGYCFVLLARPWDYRVPGVQSAVFAFTLKKGRRTLLFCPQKQTSKQNNLQLLQLSNLTWLLVLGQLNQQNKWKRAMWYEWQARVFPTGAIGFPNTRSTPKNCSDYEFLVVPLTTACTSALLLLLNSIFSNFVDCQRHV